MGWLRFISVFLAAFVATVVLTISFPLWDFFQSSPRLQTCNGVTCPYIFATWSPRSERELHIYTSDDGLHFVDWAPRTYTPKRDLLRDPSIMIHNGTYYIVHTTNWEGNDVAIIKSQDLRHWTPVTRVLTSTDSLKVIKTWAPEWFQDPETGKVHIAVSLGIPISTPASHEPSKTIMLFKQFILTAQDDNLMTWSEPRELNVQVDLEHHIDIFILYERDDLVTPYHAFEKKGYGSMQHMIAKSLDGPWLSRRIEDSKLGKMEGAAVFRTKEGKYRMLADDFHGHYRYADSDDLWHWNKMRNLPGGVYKKVRHGTVLVQ